MIESNILGLNIIVGPDDKDVMIRCLESCKGGLFDEIVITLAMPKDDPDIRAAAGKYTNKIFFFKWIENFGAARNFSFSHSTTKYILWLDSDDIIKPENYKALLELKPQLNNWDIVICDYVYSHDNRDKPSLILPRERIVKNCPEIKWHDPIHEYMNLHGIQHKTNIKIDHYRVKAHNPARNIELLGKVYDSGKASERIKFYYGKELSDYGSWDKALPVLESYINDGKDFRDNLTVACIKVAKYYFEKRDLNSAKNYAMKGIRFNSIYAENYVILGSIYESEGMLEPAEQYYKEALKKTLSGGMSQLVDYYDFIPSAKLALLYFNNKNYEDGVKYSEKALEYKPDNEHMKELSKAMILELDRLSKGVTLKESDIKNLEDFLKSININMSIIKNHIDFSDIRLKKIKNLEIVWMIPFIDINNPSVRIRRYNIAIKMRSLGINSRIMTEYYGRNNYEIRNDIGDATVVIFTSNHKFDVELIKHLKSAGVTCVYDKCEAIFGGPNEKVYLDEVDLVTCCSTKLESLLNERGFMKTCVIKDAIEDKHPQIEIVYENRYEKPKAVYMGMGGNSFLVTDHLKDVIDKAGYDLVVISEWDNATVKWNINTWPDEMVKCDVALCPQRTNIQPAKSEIKVITAMALGLPVIASPLQSYTEIINNGENGFICDDEKTWYDVLLQLKDPELRKKIGEAGKRSVSNFDLTNIARQWEKNLLDLINDRMEFKKPPDNVKTKDRSIVDIIIASYNNPEYLKLTVTSILMNTLHPFHLIISDGGSDEETWKYLKTLKGITIVGEPNKRLSFSETCNAGILTSKTKYFVILNSDIIASKYWLTNLVNKMDIVPRLAACGVLSNCDRGWLFDNPNKKDSPSYPMKLEKTGINLHPGMKMEEIRPNIEELYQFMAESNKRYKDAFVRQEWVATYATMFARSAINEVGLFDPLYKNGCEDLDLMIRLRKYGYDIGQSIDSFVFHFGGISRGAYELEDIKNYRQEDIQNHQKHRLKWDKDRIVIWTGPAWEPWNKETVDAGMAGSETWAVYLAREFVKLGYRTTIYNDLLIEDKSKAYLDPVSNEKGEKIGDVIYRDYRNLKKDVEYDLVDYFISSRSLEPLRANVHSIKNYVMIHDIWISGDKNYDIMQWRIDKYAHLSEWHRKFIMQHHGIPPHKLFLTANGVNAELYKNVNRYKKKNMTVYSSSPDRGLYQLLKMLPKIREEIPDFEVVVTYGFHNWESMAKMKKDTASMIFIDEIKKEMEQPGVNYLGRVSKKELAEYEMKANVWLYPSWFTETACITAIENGFAKNPILTTDLGGLQTTVGSAGILLPADGLSRNGIYPESYTNKFIEEAIKLIKDENYRKEWADKAYNKMQEYTWDKIAQGWINQFKI